MSWLSVARVPDLATNDTSHISSFPMSCDLRVDINSSDGPYLPPLDVKDVMMI